MVVKPKPIQCVYNYGEMMMDCVTWKNTLKLWIKERSGLSDIKEQSAHPEIKEHADLCPQCSRLLEAAKLLFNPLSRQRPFNKSSVQSHYHNSSLERCHEP